MRAHLGLVPGLALVLALVLVAFGLASVPHLGLVGPLVLALLVGLAWRRVFGLSAPLRDGTRFAARTLLKVGVVLLGIRLDFGLLAQVGWIILVADLLVISIGLLASELLGRALNMPRSLRLSLGVGTSICGASAIVAATSVTRARDQEVSVSIAVISLLGTLGVIGYTVGAQFLDPSGGLLGLMIGSTLQEVGHVIAAGYGVSREAGDLATLVKLSRVALLAPVLLLIGIVNGLGAEERAATAGGKPPPVVPWFLGGFLLLGLINTSGLLPEAVYEPTYLSSVFLTAAAMAGIGLQVEVGSLVRTGTRALWVGSVAFLGLVLAMAAYGVVAFG